MANSSNFTWLNLTDSVCTSYHEPGRRFPVAIFDFEHVKTPLVASLWILFVSIAKVGEWCFMIVWVHIDAMKKNSAKQLSVTEMLTFYVGLLLCDLFNDFSTIYLFEFIYKSVIYLHFDWYKIIPSRRRACE